MRTTNEVPQSDWPLVVVGAGAAGLLAAVFAGRQGVRTLLLETRAKPGAKIRVSGGGRCNILPSRMELDDFHSSGSMKSVRNVLLSWPLDEVRRFFEEEMGIPLVQEPNGKLFPRSGRPQEIVDALLRECDRLSVSLHGDSKVESLERSDDGGFLLRTAGGDDLRATRVVVATGGLSLPKTGSDGAGFRFAETFGHELVEPYPALVPLTTDDEAWQALSGIALPVVRLRAVQRGKVLEEREREFLFTHRGFSGPNVLDLSRYLTCPGGEDCALHVAWGGESMPKWDQLLRRGGKATVLKLLRAEFPKRLAEKLLIEAHVESSTRISELSKDARRELVEVLENYPLPVVGSEGYRTAEVTGGGVALSQVIIKTLESRLVPGLHFAGEVLDVTGRIGGFNFLWAWVSGRRAGEGAAMALQAVGN